MSTPSSQPTDNGKTIAIISYITLIGWIIALVMHMGNKTKLGAFHVRQMLGIMIAAFVTNIVATIIALIIPALGTALSLIVGIGFLILWIIGLVGAIQGQEKAIPVFGAKIQSLLGGLFN